MKKYILVYNRSVSLFQYLLIHSKKNIQESRFKKLVIEKQRKLGECILTDSGEDRVSG